MFDTHPALVIAAAIVFVSACGQGSPSKTEPVITLETDMSVADLGQPGQDGGSNVPEDMSSMTCAEGDENSAQMCSDGCSNDGDEYVDCEERDCCGVVDCAPGTFCGDMETTPGCDPGPENTVAACNDGCSNDGDQWSDCEERECCGAATGCPADSFCGLNPEGENTVDQCTSGRDNDGDDAIGCEDVSCCGVLTCDAGTACVPTTDDRCSRGSGERFENGGAIAFNVFVSYFTTVNGWTFWLEGGGLGWGWTPERTTPYTVDCEAIRTTTAQSYPNCTVTVEEQSWASDTGCGVVRGRVRVSGDGNITPAVEFVAPMRLTEAEAFSP